VSEEARDEEACRDEMAAFKARFPPEAFEGVAEALGLLPEPKNLSVLRDWLLPELYFFFVSCPGEESTRKERIRHLEDLQNAATTLLASIGPGGALFYMPRKYLGPELLSDQFRATLRSLADDAAAQIRRSRASRGQPGRPRLEAFRQLGEDLIRVYRTIGAKTAVASEWDDFYRFAVAACRCLESCMPAVVADFPKSQRAMRDNLREVWDRK
jgi:hypothetical protein